MEIKRIWLMRRCRLNRALPHSVLSERSGIGSSLSPPSPDHIASIRVAELPKSKPSKVLLRTPEQPDAPIASALRTLETEAAGINALAAAIHDGLGRTFTAAVDLIRQARGRVIVTGMGKSGHVGHKIAATLASTGTPAFFVHPSEASHGDLGMIATDDVIMAL